MSGAHPLPHSGGLVRGGKLQPVALRLATRRWAGRRRYAIAYSLGAAGYVVGLVPSALFDLPSGAVIVWTLAACGLLLAGTAASYSP